MFSTKIHNCFDSHVHWQSTGQQATRLLLGSLKSAEDIKQLKIEPHHYQGDWLIGFGWDQNTWADKKFPDKKILDELFPHRPVALSRADGHATWCNSEALRRAKILDATKKTPQNLQQIPGGKIIIDNNGEPTGVLIDAAERLVDNIIPQPSPRDIRNFLLKGMQVFNHAGFTHIRDLTCTQAQWDQQILLDEAGLMTMAVEQFFGAYEPKDFDKSLLAAIQARHHGLRLVRVKGIKVFYDGALGSEGAFLSTCYCTGSGRGLVLLSESELKEIFIKTWDADFELSVHVIGDEAAHQVAKMADQLWQQGLKGVLHLEHIEMLRPETIALLVKRPVTCHMQPCHWHTDKRWLKDKIGELYQYVFPWRALQEAEIPFFFGSDSPIEPPSIKDNFMAIEESSLNGIPKLLGSPFQHQEHPDHLWTPNTFSRFEEGEVRQVVFMGENLI